MAAVAGLLTIVVPMYPGWQSRSRTGQTKATATVLSPGDRIVLGDSAEARSIPSEKVVAATQVSPSMIG